MKFSSLPGLNLWLAMKAMLKSYGHEFIDPPALNNEMMAWGTAHSPEYGCLPYKIYQGYARELAARGVERMLVFGCRTNRACRYVDLCEGIARGARQAGYQSFDVIFWGGYGLPKATPAFRHDMGNPSWPRLIKGGVLFGTVLTATDELNDLANEARPRETVRGSVDAWRDRWWQKMGNAASRQEVKKLLTEAKKEFQEIKVDASRPIVKAAFIGDLFKVHEPFFHFDTIVKLNKLGLAVKQPQAFSLLFFGILNLPSTGRHRERFKSCQQKAKKYLQSLPGSYIDISVGETIEQLEQGAQGIVHFQSFGCMPDIILKPILDKIAADYQVPILHYLRDAHASDGAYQTRLEAFADLVKKRAADKIKTGKLI